MASDNVVVFIGRKPLRVYVGKAESVLREKSSVTLAARGVLISRAILVANRVENGDRPRLAYDVTREKGTDDIERDVPALEITLESTENTPSRLPPYGTTVFLDGRKERKDPVTAVEDVIPTISG